MSAATYNDLLGQWRRQPTASGAVAACDSLALQSEMGGVRQPSLARSMAEEASRAYPNDLEVLLSVGRMLLAHGQLQMAKRHLLGAAKLSAEPRAPRLLGEVLLRQGDAKRAVRALQRAMQLGATDEETHGWFETAAAYETVQAEQGREAVARAVDEGYQAQDDQDIVDDEDSDDDAPTMIASAQQDAVMAMVEEAQDAQLTRQSPLRAGSGSGARAVAGAGAVGGADSHRSRPERPAIPRDDEATDFVQLTQLAQDGAPTRVTSDVRQAHPAGFGGASRAPGPTAPMNHTSPARPGARAADFRQASPQKSGPPPPLPPAAPSPAPMGMAPMGMGMAPGQVAPPHVPAPHVPALPALQVPPPHVPPPQQAAPSPPATAATAAASRPAAHEIEDESTSIMTESDIHRLNSVEARRSGAIKDEKTDRVDFPAAASKSKIGKKLGSIVDEQSDDVWHAAVQNRSKDAPQVRSRPSSTRKKSNRTGAYIGGAAAAIALTLFAGVRTGRLPEVAQHLPPWLSGTPAAVAPALELGAAPLPEGTGPAATVAPPTAPAGAPEKRASNGASEQGSNGEKAANGEKPTNGEEKPPPKPAASPAKATPPKPRPVYPRRPRPRPPKPTVKPPPKPSPRPSPGGAEEPLWLGDPERG